MMADTDHGMPHTYDERFKGPKIEEQIFGTGPQHKNLPTQCDNPLEAVNDTSPNNRPPSYIEQNIPPLNGRIIHHQQENQIHLPPTFQQSHLFQGNEGSNLSAQESHSDREQEVDHLCPKVHAIPHFIATSEKKPRKRKLTSGCGNPKNQKNITEFMKQSPKRHASSFSNGGNSSSNDVLIQMPPSPTSNVVSNFNVNNLNSGVIGPGKISRLTPTNQTVSLYNNSSDSNQSPPGTVKKETQQHHQHQLQLQQQQSVEMSDAEAASRKESDTRSRLMIEDLMKKKEDLTKNLLTEQRKNVLCRQTIKNLLINQVTLERKAIKVSVMGESCRIGHFKPLRQGEQFRDVWHDGSAFEKIQKKTDKLSSEKEDLNSKAVLLKKKKPSNIKEPKRASSMSADNYSSICATSSTHTEDGFLKPEVPKLLTIEEYTEQDEILRLTRENLKKSEADIQIEKDKLDRERNLHIRELKRVQYEENSRFNKFEELHKRYLCLSLLGKGGFSEVWKAFDLEENRYVACKIHHVNKEWKEDKKANYVKHAIREKDIHKSLDHPRIVRLSDLFTVDNHCFCTVLEYCDGNDLDFYLKQHKSIPEKEARCLIMQIVSALKYLSERKPPVIHYDLKPANILLQSGTTSGEIKITDFGLSKIMENTDDTDIDLTSQGAGTYWYLPPETFVISHNPAKISSKVDVWSVGVIFYQCLFGKRPFGHELTQQRILEENTILKATEVVFPNKPQISPQAQDFIKRCLQYRKEERADVQELVKHDLFRPRGQKSQPPSSPSSSKMFSQRPDMYDVDML
uniref:Protein kinase domain-containing protein n=1 Tax=Rhabditophanes sp. KR3021 TaxID=114890 RepID=A0AC35U0C3_9BILA